jgi:DNA replication protein DnaC
MLMTQETIRKLNEMKLHAMAEKFDELHQHERYTKLSHDEVLAFLVDAEHDRRKNNQVSRLLGRAKNRLPMACVEELAYAAKRNLRKETMRDLISCAFLQNHQNVLIAGSTGVGKTFVACALINLACRNGYSARYCRLSTFLEEVATEKRIGNYLKAIERMGKIKLLVLDDIGPDILNKEQRNILMDVVEERYLKASTILTSQLPFDQWYAVFDEPTTADAICDRLFHNAFKLQLKGESMRKSTNTTPGT